MIGERLGPYRIDRELGSGGMGKVYGAVVEGRCPGLAVGTRVALKIVRPHLLEEPGFFKRFLREAEIGKSVIHENVVRTFDCDSLATDGKRADFLVMEYVEGQTLRGLLHELDRVPEELCRHIGREVSKGLAAIHAAGVVHRDIKPENVLITKEHVVKVMDLGVARLNDEALRLTQTGAFVGSIHYAAPECFREGGKHVDGRADLHALGLVLYELCCGTNPYLADDAPQILEKILHEEPRRLGEVNPQLSPFFEEVVHTLLAKQPADRFADATTLLGVLEEGERSNWWRSRATAIRAATERPLRRIRIPRETAVYGRDSEIAKLRALYEMARSGEGQVVLVEGEAGIGKSRLVDELIGCLERDGEDLNFLFGSYPPGGAATASGAFSTAYREHFGETGLEGAIRARLGVAGALAPSYAALLLGTAAPAGAEPLTKDSLQTCFIQATRSLAADRTTVVLIDDLHFAPEEGRALFASLALSAPGHRILLVGTTRPCVDERWLTQLTRLAHVTRLDLLRLGPKDLVRLLADAFHSERLASELAGQIALKSDGNPFFVFEILRGLREGQFLTQKPDGTWVTTRIVRDIRIPSSITDLVNARVADLDEDDKDLLDVASCCGFTFDAGVVASALGLAEVHALRQLARIERRHRLVRSAGERFVFDHHQVQEALYAALPPPLAHAYHAAVARALESRAGAASKDPKDLDGMLCVDLTEHFLEGGQGEPAMRYFDAALHHLASAYQSDREIALAGRALAVPGLLAGRARAEILLRLGRDAGPLELLGRWEARHAVLDEALALADAARDQGLGGRARMLSGWAHISDARYDEAEALLREALDLARAAGDRRTEAYVEGNLGHVHAHRGHDREAVEAHESALAFAREIGDRRIEAGAALNLGHVLHSLGRVEEARAQYERVLANSREVGERRAEAAATLSLGNLFYAEGRLAQAREHYERALGIHREIGFRFGEGNATVNLGTVLQALGRFSEAREYQERALAIWREIGVPDREAYALVGLGALADEEGDAAQALRLFQHALGLRRKVGNARETADVLVEVADLRRRTGDVDGAREALDEAVAMLRAQGGAGQVAVALGLLACLPGGDAQAAIAALAEAGEGEYSQLTRWLLWQATHDRAHLAEAKRLLDDLLAKNSDSRASMLANVRLNRDIAAAAKEQGL